MTSISQCYHVKFNRNHVEFWWGSDVNQLGYAEWQDGEWLLVKPPTADASVIEVGYVDAIEDVFAWANAEFPPEFPPAQK